MYKGTEIINYMEDHLGDGGSAARSYCHLGAGAPWCNAEVTLAFHEIGESKLYCDGRKEIGCPHSIKWCYKNLASLPIYLALEGDVVYFDWDGNGTPNHIGFARHRISDFQLATVEGNTSGGKIDNKIREAKCIQAVFRPLYPVDKSEFDAYKELELDGCFGFNSVAVLQRFLMLEVDGSFGLITLKAWQKFIGVEPDGVWGVKTTKATQKVVGAKVDGYCGKKTVIAWQKWLNKQVFTTGQPITKPSTTTTSSKKSNGQKIAAKALEYAYKGHPKKANYPDGEPKAAYKSAIHKYYPSYKSWSDAPEKGASCDVFVGTSVRAAGVDPKFPRGLSEQILHLKNSDKWKNIGYKGDRSVLKAGDIVVFNHGDGSHICIYAKKNCIAEANYKHTFGITVTDKNGLNYRLKNRTGSQWIRVYIAK